MSQSIVLMVIIIIAVIITVTHQTNPVHKLKENIKHSYEYKFKIWINIDIVAIYGGNGSGYEKRNRIEYLIKQQWMNINSYYNNQSNFHSIFKFLPYIFDYFQDDSNATRMDTLDYDVPLPENGLNYRVIYSHSPFGGNMIYMHSDYFNRSIRFAVKPEPEWNETIWDATPTRILCHELGHSRGAYDLYAVNVDGTKNQVFPSIAYNYPVGSVMNYLYDLNTGFDDHSVYVINQYAGQIVTPIMWSEMFWSLFPLKFGVRVKDMYNNSIRDASVTFYGVRWLQRSINMNDRIERKTDANGEVTFNGTDSANNPYGLYGLTSVGAFSNFMVVVYNEGNGVFNWLPVFTVQTAKIHNETEYYLEFQFNIKPKIEFIFPLSASLDITIPRFLSLPANNDSLCQVRYALVVIVNLSVHAWDIDGTIVKVEFYSDHSFLGQTTTPYSIEWQIATNGTYNVFAKAYDNLDAVTQSSVVIVNVTSDESDIDAVVDMITNHVCLV